MKKLFLILYLTGILCAPATSAARTTNIKRPAAKNKPSPTIIITGFGAFLDITKNPSWTVVNNLPGSIDNVKIIKQKLPINWKKTKENIKLLIQQHPHAIAIISVGYDPRPEIKNIRVEQGAVNQEYGADNTGDFEFSNKIFTDGKPELNLNSKLLSNNITLQSLVNAIKQQSKVTHIIAGTASEFHTSAGTYICNETFYSALYYAAQAKKHMYATFIHIPSFKNVSQPNAQQVLIRYIKLIINKKAHQTTQRTHI